MKDILSKIIGVVVIVIIVTCIAIPIISDLEPEQLHNESENIMQKVESDADFDVVYDYTGSEPVIKYLDQTVPASTTFTIVCENAIMTYYQSGSNITIRLSVYNQDNQVILENVSSGYGSPGSVRTLVSFENGTIVDKIRRSGTIQYTNCYITSTDGDYRQITNGDITIGASDNAIFYNGSGAGGSSGSESVIVSITGGSADIAQVMTIGSPNNTYEKVEYTPKPEISDEFYTYDVNRVIRDVSNNTTGMVICPYSVGDDAGQIFDIINMVPIVIIAGLILSVSIVFLNIKLNR